MERAIDCLKKKSIWDRGTTRCKDFSSECNGKYQSDGVEITDAIFSISWIPRRSTSITFSLPFGPGTFAHMPQNDPVVTSSNVAEKCLYEKNAKV